MLNEKTTISHGCKACVSQVCVCGVSHLISIAPTKYFSHFDTLYTQYCTRKSSVCASDSNVEDYIFFQNPALTCFDIKIIQFLYLCIILYTCIILLHVDLLPDKWKTATPIHTWFEYDVTSVRNRENTDEEQINQITE